MNLGVSATREGLSREQLRYVREDMQLYDRVTLRQGCCVGGDEQITVIAASLGTTDIIGHPPERTDYLSKIALDLCTSIRSPKPYLARDNDIIAASDYVIACPSGRTEIMRGSGTWYVIRECERRGVRCYVVYPDGGFELRA